MENKSAEIDEIVDSNPSSSTSSDLDLALSDLPEEKRKQIVKAIVAVERRSYSGPLPAPEDFEKYKYALPDAPERILSMAERQQSHRIEMESTVVREDVSLSKRGQIFGFIITIFFGSIALYLGIEGHDWLAGVIATAVIGTLAAIFVLRKEPSAKNDVPRPSSHTDKES